MTYCVGLHLSRGLVFMSDTRTNAGLDNVSTFRKMTTWEVPGERMVTVMTAGNLATTQAVISLLEERSKAASDRSPSILEQPSMFQIARLVGQTLKEVIAEQSGVGQEADAMFGATMILGGQVKPGPPRLFLIYPEGNFVEASADTPFFQIGETKYGRPILVRAYDPDMSFEAAIKLMLLSFDSTLKANLSVGMPLDFQVYTTDSLVRGREGRFHAEDAYYRTIADGWSLALTGAVESMPDFDLDA